MLTELEIKEIIEQKAESKNVDYKERCNWKSAAKDDKTEIVKDILAMANTQDGGKIVFGVRDSNFEFVGLNEDDYHSFDQTKVNDFLHKYSDPKHSCQVVKQLVDQKRVVVLDVPEFSDVPVICKKDAHSSKDGARLILAQGQLYIRTDKASTQVIPGAQEMRELLGRALTKKGDELLHNIKRLIKGKPARTSDESKAEYEAETVEAEQFFLEKLGSDLENYGYWEVLAYPVEHAENRIALSEIKDLIKNSEVHLRGWDFPHTDTHGGTSNFNKGRQSVITWERYREAYRAYTSGLFIWNRVTWEDLMSEASKGSPSLSFISAIYSVTEFFLFLKRYYEKVSPDDDLAIFIKLTRTAGRSLVSLDDGSAPLPPWYKCDEEQIVLAKTVKVVDLMASSIELANQTIREIFSIFNWDDVQEKVVADWQTKLIERRF